MGIVKKMMQEREEQEYRDHLREIEQHLLDLHRAYPREGWNKWDAESYEAFCLACDKDD